MIWIVSGISSGIGKALVELLLSKEEKVIGVGRSNPFGERIDFKHCDLSKADEVNHLQFPSFQEEVVLVNNAGMIGEISRISQKKENDFAEVFQVNTIATINLTQLVYAAMKDKNRFRLVNISSGAANNAIPSWAAYCASKAALNMWTTCFAKEEAELGFSLKVYCVAPGVVDTKMQGQIRSTKGENFSSLNRFIDLNKNGELTATTVVAEKLLNLLQMDYSGELFYDLRHV